MVLCKTCGSQRFAEYVPGGLGRVRCPDCYNTSVTWEEEVQQLQLDVKYFIALHEAVLHVE